MYDAEIARGSWQRYLWSKLLQGHTLPSPERSITGHAADYNQKYRRSFQSLLARARAAGYEIERTPGVRGGEWGATYRVSKVPAGCGIEEANAGTDIRPCS